MMKSNMRKIIFFGFFFLSLVLSRFQLESKENDFMFGFIVKNIKEKIKILQNFIYF